MNRNQSEFTCGACKKKVMHDPSKGHVPPGWRMRSIGGGTYSLCEAHSTDHHFVPTLSSALRELFAAQGITFPDDI